MSCIVTPAGLELTSILCAGSVVNPMTTTTCHGGQDCTIEWLDNGQRPLLSDLGICTVGLYTGEMQLLQHIEPIDVSLNHSLTFTPNPNAGPNSNAYYVAFFSTEVKNNSQPYISFTPNFSIDQMSGSFGSSVASLTSTVPIPSAILTATQAPIQTTTLSGIISIATAATSSGFNTVTSSKSSIPTNVSGNSNAAAATNPACRIEQPSFFITLASSMTLLTTLAFLPVHL
ncbi:hypothetical protein HETIRDRAFT_105500 [Heterobasidion irregulare TC 32-1]|uniref:Yeast cell wall synthesis Kre9/Knh1-like N-terminal domain-containing protein n=1 Tax=Heterobasidion irregulare (strain TC 32-1) TaxID=747525 RepID=W4JV57_HETIT|nr:uncharacterized protein HETIRDRAFT_105500 [Heterobasidion irregulare TC 32-1]ETW77354.1 hypothetical protein HETIRDRAFT_105500 [Heterobasidion irregulare TC 32-1]